MKKEKKEKKVKMEKKKESDDDESLRDRILQRLANMETEVPENETQE